MNRIGDHPHDSPLFGRRVSRGVVNGLLATAVLGATLALGGCQTATVAQPLTAELATDDPVSRVNFWHELADRPMVSHDEAFHALLMYFEQRAVSEGYQARKSALQDRGWLPKGFDKPADEAISRGTLAVILCRAMDIKGGVIMRIVGPIPRYANRELQYLDIYPRSSPNQTLSGSQFVGVLSRVEDRLQQRFAQVDEAAGPTNAAEGAEPSRPQTPPDATTPELPVDASPQSNSPEGT